MPQISVITGVLADRASLKHFGDTFMSVKEQTHPDFEWVICFDIKGTECDGFSPEQVRDWAYLYAGTPLIHGENIRVFTSDLSGVGAARHTAILHANSPLVRNLDGDDILLPGALERCVKHLSIPGVTHGYSNTIEVTELGEYNQFLPDGSPFFGEHGPGWLPSTWPGLPEGKQPVHLNTLHMTRRAYIRAGGYAAVARAQDLPLAVSLSNFGSVYVDPEPQSTYLKWEGGKTKGGEAPIPEPTRIMRELLYEEYGTWD